MKGRSASKIKLTSYDELLGGGEETNDIQQVSLEHLHSFENHPFQVNDDEAMAELVESVKEEGILTALLVRPLGDGEYEIIAGHRRRHAAQLAGLKEVPVIIRNMDQDTAVRAMVDSNLQRPNILPSEKAFAYRMKMEAMNHQGTSGGISAKDIGKNANDSARQVYRYIRLTYLMNDLLNAVDRDVIGLQVGVELSYLTVPEQEMVEEVHESTGKYPSLEQAKKIRQHREEKTLTRVRYNVMLSEGENTYANDEWSRLLPDIRHNATVDLDAVFGELQLINPRAKSFLCGIQAAFMASDTHMADELIRKRERSLKGAARAKLSRTKEFDHSKWVGGGMLDYRFSNARRIVNDIYSGEVSADV